MIGDRAVDLIEAGVPTNAYKSIDRGVTVTGMLAGTEHLSRFADRNPAIRVRPFRYTHGFEVLSRIERLRAVNSAVEVDLSGQVNGEAGGGNYVGAIGGQVDFARGANSAPGGRSIIALPSPAR